MAAKPIAELVEKEVVARFRVPSTIHSDQGKQFEGNPDSKTMLGQRWHMVVLLAYGWG